MCWVQGAFASNQPAAQNNEKKPTQDTGPCCRTLSSNVDKNL